ncbi:hypothetical protein [Mesorhizobium sp. LSJC269B00]|uniref:hypothetical protein n=1 Tax=Mesorhizobium sp. LSJC269B00 TaxID=1287326 RepID=UPI0012EB3717|nr:hypothetical protein [Mesorhizobium sp. LSJC269B00]
MANGLQWISIVAAFLGAFFWFWSASVSIPPVTMALWRDGKITRPPHEKALKRQSQLSAIAAVFAGVASAFQGLSFYLSISS